MTSRVLCTGGGDSLTHNSGLGTVGLASGSVDGTVRLWCPNANASRWHCAAVGHAHDGTLISIQVWEIRKLTLCFVCSSTQVRYSPWRRTRAGLCSPRRRTRASRVGPIPNLSSDALGSARAVFIRARVLLLTGDTERERGVPITAARRLRVFREATTPGNDRGISSLAAAAAALLGRRRGCITGWTHRGCARSIRQGRGGW